MDAIARQRVVRIVALARVERTAAVIQASPGAPLWLIQPRVSGSSAGGPSFCGAKVRPRRQFKLDRPVRNRATDHPTGRPGPLDVMQKIRSWLL